MSGFQTLRNCLQTCHFLYYSVWYHDKRPYYFHCTGLACSDSEGSFMKDRINRFLRKHTKPDKSIRRPNLKGTLGRKARRLREDLKGKSAREAALLALSRIRAFLEEGLDNGYHTSRHSRLSWLFILPSLAGVCLFFFLPFLVVIFYSFVNNPVQHRFVGFANYIRAAGNAAFLLAAGNTLKFTAISVPLAVLLSLGLAVMMDTKIPFRSAFRTAFLTPMMVPVASVILIWEVLFHYHGLANDLIGIFGAGPVDWMKSEYAPIVIATLFQWKNLGYNMILFMAGLASIPRDILEVARLESASSLQIFLLIKLRYLSSTIVFVTIMSVINSFKVFREIYLMTGNYPYDSLYMLQHFMNNTFNSLDYQKLSAAAILMSLIMIVIIAVMFKAENRISRDLEY